MIFALQSENNKPKATTLDVGVRFESLLEERKQ